MKTSARYVITIATGVLLPLPALAHWGHFGELAGHGHLVAAGLGVVVVMGVAGLAAFGKKDDQNADEAADLDADASDVSVEDGEKTHA